MVHSESCVHCRAAAARRIPPLSLQVTPLLASAPEPPIPASSAIFPPVPGLPPPAAVLPVTPAWAPAPPEPPEPPSRPPTPPDEVGVYEELPFPQAVPRSPMARMQSVGQICRGDRVESMTPGGLQRSFRTNSARLQQQDRPTKWRSRLRFLRPRRVARPTLSRFGLRMNSARQIPAPATCRIARECSWPQSFRPPLHFFASREGSPKRLGCDYRGIAVWRAWQIAMARASAASASGARRMARIARTR
jgi:hypothetical protein